MHPFDRQHHPVDCPVHGHPGTLTRTEYSIYGFWALLPRHPGQDATVYRVFDVQSLPALALWARWHDLHPLTLLEGVLAMQGALYA